MLEWATKRTADERSLMTVTWNETLPLVFLPRPPIRETNGHTRHSNCPHSGSTLLVTYERTKVFTTEEEMCSDVDEESGGPNHECVVHTTPVTVGATRVSTVVGLRQPRGPPRNTAHRA